MGPLWIMMWDIDREHTEQGKPPLTPEQMDSALVRRLRDSITKWKSIPPKTVEPQRQEDAFKNCRNYTQIWNNFTCND